MQKYCRFLTYVTFIYDFWINSLIYIAMLYIILKHVFRSVESGYSFPFSISSFIFCRLFDSMDKIQIRTIFLFQFKLDRKAAETARDINDAFGPGTTNERVANGGSRNFAMVTRASKIKTVAAGRLRLIIEADPRKTTRDTRSCCWNRGRPLNSRSPFIVNKEVKKVR